MHLPIIIRPKYHKFLLYALLVSADEVRFFKMELERPVISVVAVRVIFAAHMARLVVLLHVLHEIGHIKKVHFTKLAPRVIKYNLSVFVDFALV